jgi:hypothetical protein
LQIFFFVIKPFLQACVLRLLKWKYQITFMKRSRGVYWFIMMLCLIVAKSHLAEAQMRIAVRARVGARMMRPHRVAIRRAHFRYAHMPRWGTTVAVLPPAAIAVRSGGLIYHFHNGVFYAPRGRGYIVVRPTLGVRVRMLPVGYRTVVLGPRRYYYYYGTFYKGVDSVNEYEVVNPPVGAVVDALPDGYEIKKSNGTEYYVLDGVYYAEVDTNQFADGIGYEVVKVDRV